MGVDSGVMHASPVLIDFTAGPLAGSMFHWLGLQFFTKRSCCLRRKWWPPPENLEFSEPGQSFPIMSTLAVTPEMLNTPVLSGRKDCYGPSDQHDAVAADPMKWKRPGLPGMNSMNKRSHSLRTRGRRIAGALASAWMCGLWPATPVTPLVQAAEPGLQRVQPRTHRGILNLEDLVKKRPAVVLPTKSASAPITPATNANIKPAAALFEVVDKPSTGTATVSFEVPETSAKATEPPAASVNPFEQPVTPVETLAPPVNPVETFEAPTTPVESLEPPAVQVDLFEPPATPVESFEPPASPVESFEPPATPVESFELPTTSAATFEPPASLFDEPVNEKIAEEPVVRDAVDQSSSPIEISSNRVLPDIDPAIRELVTDLSAEDHEIRQMAAFTLGESGEEAQVALPALRQTMFSNYTMVRLHAAEAVAKLSPGDDAAIEVLLQGLDDNNSDVRVMAATALMGVAPNHQGRALQVLHVLRNDANPHVRMLAETALPIAEPRQTAPVPKEDYELPTRTVEPLPEQARSLSTPARVAPEVVEDISNSEPSPVAEISSQPTVEPQADAFDEHFTVSQPEATAVPVAEVLDETPVTESEVVGTLPTASATVNAEKLPALPPALADLATRLSSGDPAQQKYALSELAWFGTDARAVLPYVQACLSSNDEVVRAHAAKALHDIAPEFDQQAVAVLADLVQSLQPGVSPLAAYFLGEFDSGAFTALPALRRVLSESTGQDQLHIAEAILRIEQQDAGAASVLAHALNDEDESSRFFAACALIAAAPHQEELIVPALLAAQGDQSARVRMAADISLTGFQIEPKGVAAVVMTQPEPEPVIIEQPAVVEPAVVVEETPAEPVVVETEITGSAQVQLVQDVAPAPKPDDQSKTDEIPPEFDTNLPVEKWTAQTPGETKPIRFVTINTAPKRRDAEGRLQELPTNYGAAFLEQQGQTRTGQESRPWIVTSKCYEAPAFCHRPLYFEEVNLERYGHHFHCVQPLVSAAHFYGRVPFLPYLATVSKPWECEYPLGKYRPGSCTPYEHELVPLRADAVLVQAGVMAVPFFIIH